MSEPSRTDLLARIYGLRRGANETDEALARRIERFVAVRGEGGEKGE